MKSGQLPCHPVVNNGGYANSAKKFYLTKYSLNERVISLYLVDFYFYFKNKIIY